MKKPSPRHIGAAAFALALAAALGGAALFAGSATGNAPPGPAAAAKPALTVAVAAPEQRAMPLRLAANGGIAAWQEASVGSEIGGLRLAELRAHIGDTVRRGAVLATLAADTVAVELAHSRALLAEAEASLADARANAQRARQLQNGGALSSQQIDQLVTGERTAQARRDAAEATARMNELRLAQTQVLAPEDGIITSRSATVGAVVQVGQELFRLVRGGRLEWRAEVAAPMLARLKAGLAVTVTPVGGERIKGRVRLVAPAVDPQTRNGLVFVDLPPGTTARSGMFARGEIELAGDAAALTLPRSAVLHRDGLDYVHRVGPDSKVALAQVTLGRRGDDRVEVVQGLAADTRVVAGGGAFLADGDLVRVVPSLPAAPPAAPPAASQAGGK